MINNLVILVSLLLLISAVMLVLSQNLVRTVLLLSAHLLITAFLFVALNASFLAMVQVLLYTGGALILSLFAVMLNHQNMSQQDLAVAPVLSKPKALLIAVFLFLALGLAIDQSSFPVETLSQVPVLSSQSGLAKEIGADLYSNHILSFELLSLLLVAVLIGTLVIAKKSDEVLS
jgi:NADH-quinone oxidoreductase subunit J